MGRLIDTDVLEAFIKTHSCVVGSDGVLLTDGEDKRWHNLLEYIPTAYDVESIVEELKKHKDTTDLTTVDEEMVAGFTVYQGAFNDAIDKAIETVKQGGVSDDVCEWKTDSHLENDAPAEWLICPHSPKKIFSTDIKYCPYCGKRIKVVE